MTEGQYTFGDAIKNVEIIVGGNYKKYILDSDGTLFIDTLEANWHQRSGRLCTGDKKTI